MSSDRKMTPDDNSSPLAGDDETGVIVSDQHMNLILQSLPPATPEVAKQALGVQLRQWLTHEFPRVIHYTRMRDVTHLTSKDRKRTKAAANSLDQTLDLLSRVDPEVREAIDSYLWTHPSPDERRDPPNLCDDDMQYLRAFSNAMRAVAGIKYRAGARPNTVGRATIIKIAQLFEAATGMTATRRKADTGPFHQFAAAVWPVIFGQGDDGLSTAILYWSKSGRSQAIEVVRKNAVPKRGGVGEAVRFGIEVKYRTTSFFG